MVITAEQVKELREKTGAGMMECKKALTEAQGDVKRAETILRERGQSAAAKKAGRVARQGIVGHYIHPGGKLGVLVEVNCETDFVERTDDFKELVRDIAMQIAASNPLYIRKEDVSEEDRERERAIYLKQAQASGKPPQVLDKIVEGKLGKYYAEVALYEQPFIKNPDITVGDLITSKIAKIGENILVKRFARFKIGEAE
jgi:elongation factor Ts